MTPDHHLSEAAERQPLADLEASSRLCLAALPGLGAEAETLASQAHGLLLEAQLEERRPYVTVRLRAADARVASLALSAGPGSAWQPGQALTRAAGALNQAGWSQPGESGPRDAEELAELELEQIDRLLAADRRRAGGEPPADWLGLGPGEREALRWLTQGEEEGEGGLPDDYVMIVQEVAGSAVEQLAGRLEELHGSRPEGAPGRAALGERLGLGYESWRRVAAAALADDLEPALGSLPLAGEGDAV